MPTCSRAWAGLCLFAISLQALCATATPYGTVSVDLGLGKVEGAPVYYVVGKSGVPGSANEGHTSNAGFVVTNEGVVVFDTLGTPALGFRLLQEIRRVTDQPVRAVVISHYHADHIYGLQAFADHAGQPDIIAQAHSASYRAGNAASQGEDASRRLAQRRDALWPWVDETTRIVPPTRLFEDELRFELGDVTFDLRHLGPAHAPGDTIMLVGEYGVMFSGDLVYKGRIPYLDSPSTDVFAWLEGLGMIDDHEPPLRFLIPGHGEPSDEITTAVAATRDYIEYLIDGLQPAVEAFAAFDEAYAAIDWSPYADMPAFGASNRGNAYRVFLELEARSLEQ